ncbi:hypothetical protein KC343_g22824, partial [Hortaea werneckii]
MKSFPKTTTSAQHVAAPASYFAVMDATARFISHAWTRLSTKKQPEKPARGIFAPLLGSLKKRNPSNFMLPEELRERDQYVHTGKDGSFTESVNPRTRNRAGYDEVPDYYKYKDSKGNAVLCYFCGKSS